MNNKNLITEVLLLNELKENEIEIYDKGELPAYTILENNILEINSHQVLIPMNDMEKVPERFSVANSDIGNTTENPQLKNLLTMLQQIAESRGNISTTENFSTADLMNSIKELEAKNLSVNTILIPPSLLEDFTSEFPGVLSENNTLEGVSHSGSLFSANVYVHNIQPWRETENFIFVLSEPQYLGVFQTIQSTNEWGMGILNPERISTIKVVK